MLRYVSMLFLIVATAGLAGTPPTTFDGQTLDAVTQTLAAIPETNLSTQQRRLYAFAAIARCGATQPPPESCVAPEIARIANWQESETDPELAAMLANLTGMTASYAKPMQAMQIARQAQRQFDRLVLDHPGHGGVLLQRAVNGLYSPRVAGRWTQATIDLQTLLEGDFGLGAGDRLYILSLHAAAALRIEKPALAQPSLDALQASGSAYWAAAAERIAAGELP